MGQIEKLLAVREVAALLGLSPRTLYGLAERRAIPTQRVRRRLMFRPSMLEAWLAKQAHLDRKTFRQNLQNQRRGKASPKEEVNKNAETKNESGAGRKS